MPERIYSQGWPLTPQEAEQVLEEARSGLTLPDRRFDKIFSPRARALSRQHWTPLCVGRRAAALLADGRECRILDVGAGVGKFCLVGALTTRAHFFGIEQRSWLAGQARDLANRLAIPRVQFLHGAMEDLDWDQFDGFYFYNPFYEHLETASRIDDNLVMGVHTFRKSADWVSRRLAQLRTGSRIVTFHGFGGDFPSGYDREIREPAGDDFLDLWIKKRAC